MDGWTYIHRWWAYDPAVNLYEHAMLHKIRVAFVPPQQHTGYTLLIDLIRIRYWELAPNPSRIPYTGGCKLIGMRGSNGLFLRKLPCFGLGILVGFTKGSLSKAWGKGLCVSGDSPGRRRPCIGSSSSQSMVEIWKFTGRRRRKEKIGPHHPEQGVLNLHLALPLWNPNFQRATHIYQRIHTKRASTCELRPIADLQYREWGLCDGSFQNGSMKSSLYSM